MSTYLEKARKAFALSQKGRTNIEIKVALGMAYAKDADHAIAVGSIDASFEEPRLTADELTLIMSVARMERLWVEKSYTRAPNLKYCGGHFWAKGKAERVARKRLGSHRKGEDWTERGTGLRLLNPWHGGYVRLTPAGWAFVHAIEAEQARSAEKAA